MSMKASLILKFDDLSKAQKSKYLENDRLFFLQIKNGSLHIEGYSINKTIYDIYYMFYNNSYL